MGEITITAFQAYQGESFLISFEDVNILVDCGTREAYRDFIKDKLISLNKEGQKIDLLVITHFDNDHIEGAVELLTENISNDDHKIIKINEIWVNSYFNSEFIDKVSEEITSEDYAFAKKEANKRYNKRLDNTKIRLVGIEEATSLTSLITKGNYLWNKHLDGRAINIENSRCVRVNSKVKIHVLSPRTDNLKKLDEFWKTEILNKKDDFKFTYNEVLNDLFEYWISRLDKDTNPEIRHEISSDSFSLEELFDKGETFNNSVINDCSIAFVIEINDKRLLFTGDIESRSIIDQLKKLYPDEDKIRLELVKIPHHGSKNNTAKDFLESIRCSKYLISTDGSYYNHPSPETLSKIILREPKGNKIYINCDNISPKNKTFFKYILDENTMKNYVYEIELLNGNKFELD
jgi:beta-lactamase superfamily II metal-dependent hydrolase